MKPSVKKTIDALKGASNEPDGPAEADVSDTPRELADDSRLVVFDGASFDLSELATERLDNNEEGDMVPARNVFKVRLARSRALYDAGALVQRRYAYRGYDTPNTAGEGDPQLITFVAYSQGVVVGTVSIRLDMPGIRGLAAETLYPDEIAKIRDAGGRICEFTRLAVDTEASSKPILAALFHTAYLFASKVRGYDCAVIEVNPRHVIFYRRALKFDVIGTERLNRRVNAPAVLLCVSFDAIQQGLERYAGHLDLATKTHTLFPYGFPPEEESGVLRRLQSLQDQDLV